MSKDQPLVKIKESGDQYPKGHHHALSGIVSGDCPLHHHKLIWLEGCTDL